MKSFDLIELNNGEITYTLSLGSMHYIIWYYNISSFINALCWSLLHCNKLYIAIWWCHYIII